MFYESFDRSSEQLRELDARLAEFDATVIGISTGSSSRAAQLHEQLELRFDLYSDSKLTVIPSWGVDFVMANVTSDAVFIVEPGGQISYKHLGSHPSLSVLAAKTRR
jgi:peroxiredoxin